MNKCYFKFIAGIIAFTLAFTFGYEGKKFYHYLFYKTRAVKTLEDGIPIYSDMVETHSVFACGAGFAAKSIYEVDDSSANVIQFYRNCLLKQGWKINHPEKSDKYNDELIYQNIVERGGVAANVKRVISINGNFYSCEITIDRTSSFIGFKQKSQ